MDTHTHDALQLCKLARERGLISPWDAAPALGAVLVTGADAEAYLQAQLTSDVAELKSGDGQLSSRLNPRGGLLAWFSLHRLPDRGQPFPGYFLILPVAEIPDLIEDLNRFVINADVLIEDVSGDFEGWLIQGPIAAEAETHLFSRDLPVDISRFERSFTGDPGALYLWPSGGETARRAAACRSLASGLKLANLDDGPASHLAWHALRVEAGWPLIGIDLQAGARVLPQTGLENRVLSPTKGCFPGQEVVARIRTYGSVSEALRGLVFLDLPPDDLPAMPEPGRDILDLQGEKIGVWASKAVSTVWEAPIAMAFLNRSHRTPGETLGLRLTTGEAEARIVLLPFHLAEDARSQSRSLHNKAVHLYGAGRDAEAIRLLGDSLALDPLNHDACEALGVILGNAGRYQDAIDIFHALEESAPDEAMVHVNLSLFYMKIGNTDEAERQKALATMKRFSGSGPEDAARRDAAAVDHEKQNAERQKEMFAQVLALDAEDSLALMGLGKAQAVLGEFEAAALNLSRALDGQAENPSLYLARAQVLEKMGDPLKARSVYEKGIEVASRRGDLTPLQAMEHRLLLLKKQVL